MGIGPTRAAGESGEGSNRVCAGGDLIDRAVIVGVAALVCGPEEVAAAVKCYIAIGIGPTRAAGEGSHSDQSGRAVSNLPNYADALRTAPAIGRAEQIAQIVYCHRAKWMGPVRAVEIGEVGNRLGISDCSKAQNGTAECG